MDISFYGDYIVIYIFKEDLVEMSSWSYIMSQDPVEWKKFIKKRFEEYEKSREELKEGDEDGKI